MTRLHFLEGLFLLRYVLAMNDLVQMGLDWCQVDRFCNGNVPVKVNTTGCCKPCSCDRSCVLSRNCCPDADFDITSLPEHPYQRFSTCEHSVTNLPVGMTLDTRTPYFTMVTRCLDGYTCKPPNQYLFATNKSSGVVVSDKKTGIVFVNKLCAICHGVNDFVEWTIEIDFCQKDPGSMLESFASGVVSLDKVLKNCRLLMLPPNNFRIASERFICRNWVHNECNATQLWVHYNVHLEKACTSGIFEVVRNNWIGESYRNPFCIRCNFQEDMISDQQERICTKGMKTVFSMFSSILRLLDHNMEKPVQNDGICDPFEIFDSVQGICRPYYCPPLLRPKSRKCVHVPFLIYQYRYFVFLKFTFISPSSNLMITQQDNVTMAESLVQRAIELTTIQPDCLLFAHVMQYAHSLTSEAGYYVAAEIMAMDAVCKLHKVLTSLDMFYQDDQRQKISGIQLNARIIDIPIFRNDSLLFSYIGDYYSIRSRIEMVQSVKIGNILCSHRHVKNVRYVDIPLIRTTGPYVCPFFKFDLSEVCKVLSPTINCNYSEIVSYNSPFHADQNIKLQANSQRSLEFAFRSS